MGLRRKKKSALWLFIVLPCVEKKAFNNNHIITLDYGWFGHQLKIKEIKEHFNE